MHLGSSVLRAGPPNRHHGHERYGRNVYGHEHVPNYQHGPCSGLLDHYRMCPWEHLNPAAGQPVPVACKVLMLCRISLLFFHTFRVEMSDQRTSQTPCPCPHHPTTCLLTLPSARIRRRATASVKHPTRPSNGFQRTFATATAISREMSYPQLHLRAAWISWISPPPLGGLWCFWSTGLSLRI